MRPLLQARLAAALTALHLTACAMPPSTAPESAPVRGAVSDLPAFESYVATHPTPQDFRAHYPDVALVLPGDIATKELRLNHSRYFATLDDAGRISGGRFQ